MTGKAGPAELDHAVIMVRDRMEELAPGVAGQGYTLSETATHNLGSWNRLIVLEHAYIELLGWPAGTVPARKEIADSPLGLEALVLRTQDAQATYERLRDAGYAVNPVQKLTRPARLDGQQVEARFDTVRFAVQPVPGMRIYFCQHLTPECVWQPALMRHANGARAIVEIAAQAPDAADVAVRFARVADTKPTELDDGTWEVPLGHTRLRIASAAAGQATALRGLTVEHHDGSRLPFQSGL
jgi:hypothetical protein